MGGRNSGVGRCGRVRKSASERVRAENMARNEEFLTEIGIGDVKPRARDKTSQAKRQRGVKVVIPIDPLKVRRSSRVAALPVEHAHLSYAEVSDDDEVKKGIRYSRKRNHTATSTTTGSDEDGDTTAVVPYAAQKIVAGESRSSREVQSNYAFFIGTDETSPSSPLDTTTNKGDNDEKNSSSSSSSSNNNLASLIRGVGFGKAAIMAASYNDRCPKFSKYVSTCVCVCVCLSLSLSLSLCIAPHH